MRLVVTGASGNVGTALLDVLADDPAIDRIVAVARRTPAETWPRTRWHALDVAVDDLAAALHGADAVVHLAWAIQPSRDVGALWRTNVLGTRRVVEAALAAGCRAIVVASSVGAYAPRADERPVDESWPVGGVPSSFYARHKTDVEAYLDRVEASAPAVRIVRLRPQLIFGRDAAAEQRRLFAGPFVPPMIFRRGRVPLVPLPRGLLVQAVHREDAARAYRAAILRDVRGPYNVAAPDVLDPAALAGLAGGRPVVVSAAAARAVMAALWRARLQPSPPGWLDMAVTAPALDASRARRDLGWRPGRSTRGALLDLAGGLRDDAGRGTPPLRPGSPRSRLGEILHGVGG